MVCLGECGKQLADTGVPLPSEPGQAERHDYEYGGRGTANLSMLFKPLAGWRHVKATERRTAVDFVEAIRGPLDIRRIKSCWCKRFREVIFDQILVCSQHSAGNCLDKGVR